MTQDRRPQVLKTSGRWGSSFFFAPLELLHVFYEFDEDESKHLLALEEYGRRESPNAWVLLHEA